MSSLISFHVAIVIGTIILIAITEAHDEWVTRSSSHEDTPWK